MRAIAWSGLTRSDVKYVSVTATPSVLVGLVFIPLELLRPSILTILFLAGLFKNRPEAVPAAIIVDAGLRLDDGPGRSCACGASTGILIGVLTSFFLVIHRGGARGGSTVMPRTVFF